MKNLNARPCFAAAAAALLAAAPAGVPVSSPGRTQDGGDGFVTMPDDSHNAFGRIVRIGQSTLELAEEGGITTSYHLSPRTDLVDTDNHRYRSTREIPPGTTVLVYYHFEHGNRIAGRIVLPGAAPAH